MYKQVLLLLTLLTPLLLAETSSEKGRLSGRIVTESGNPLADAQVTILKLRSSTFSKENGKFLTDTILAGSYTIQVNHLGFEKRQLADITILANQVNDLGNIILKEKLIELEGTLVTASRSLRKTEEISKAFNLINHENIQYRNAKTSAEVLREETGVFVQKTNHGGGSAIIRGLSSNQILILVDGIRLNNSTYRLGNHQYLTTVDFNMLDKIEVVRGPSSVLYGSDALGGTINLITRRPKLTSGPQIWDYNFQLIGRHATADGEKSGRIENAFYNQNIALLSGFSTKRFGDLRRGGNSKHPQLEKSTDGLKQSPSGYQVYDADAKLFYALPHRQELLLAYQYSNQKNVPRYDKYESGKNVQWLYTPQKRHLTYLQYRNKIDQPYLSSLRMNLSWQHQKEGRVTQKKSTANIITELDNVRTLGLTLQMSSEYLGHQLNYGLDIYRDRVRSQRDISDPLTLVSRRDKRGRYPDKARYNSSGAYLQDEWYLNPRLLSTFGIRYSHFSSQFELPAPNLNVVNFSSLKQTFQAFTGSTGFMYKLSSCWNISANVSQAFRAPNLSDISKLGESKGAVFEIPNNRLEPEKMLSSDLGIRLHSNTFQASLTGHYARISNLLASTESTLNGKSKIIIGGDTLKIKTKDNIGNAFITGIEFSGLYRYHPHFNFYGNVTYTYGQNTTQKEPIGGIPPLFGLIGNKWEQGKYFADTYLRIAAEQKRLSADDLDDPRIPAGGTPGWHTYNMRIGVKPIPALSLKFSIENILDSNYREHGSGINGPGRNFIITFEYKR